MKLLKFECTPFSNSNCLPCSVGLLQPQPEEESPLSCHDPSGLQNREDTFHPAGTWLCVWCCVREYTCIFKCYMCMVCGCVLQLCMVYGFVYMCISVCHCVSTFRMVDASLQVYLHVYLITQVHTIEHSYSFGNCSLFSCYMLQLTQSDVIV